MGWLMVDTGRAGPADLAAVGNVLDGGLLRVTDLPAAVDRGDVLTAVSATDTVLGALVLAGTEITAVAVRRRRRGQGIGTALVGAAAREREGLVAEFDERVRPFWRSVGFDTEPIGNGRYRGRY
jgi:GNAT superfamily N-acetyltransferase